MNKGSKLANKIPNFQQASNHTKQTRFYHGNKTTLDESINVLKNASAVYVNH